MYLFWLIAMGFAFIFLILAVLAPKHKLVFAMISLVLWFSLAATTAALQIPYTFYNQTDNVVYTGNFQVETGAPGLSTLCLGMGMFTFAWVFILAVDEYLVRAGRRPLLGK